VGSAVELRLALKARHAAHPQERQTASNSSCSRIVVDDEKSYACSALIWDPLVQAS
jgi:hypothetical protein